MKERPTMCATEGRIPVRVVLAVLTFFMFVLTQFMRSNLYLVIIDVTNIGNSSGALNETSSTEKFGWTNQQVGMLMGSVFWVTWMTELPGGILATRFGGTRLLLISVLMAALLNLAFPLASRLDFHAALAIRLLQGFVMGVSWPCVHVLSARWIPLVERSKFTSTYNGLAVGNALNSVLSGVLITYLGWQYVFYVSGALTLLWCGAWKFLVYDSPSQHPRISIAERNYLQESVSPSKNKTQKIPWQSILKSGPFWAVTITAQAAVWIFVTLAMQMPAYLSTVQHIDMTTNGLVSCLPEIFKFVCGLIISAVMDSAIKQKILSVTAVRKIAVTISTLLPGLLLLLLQYCAHDTTLAVVIIILATSATSASTSGHLAAMVDIAPNYAGILMGLVKTVVVIPGALSPLFASILVSGDDIAAGWQKLFYVTAVIGTASCLSFLLLGSGEVQPWNDEQQEKEKVAEAEDLVLSKE